MFHFYKNKEQCEKCVQSRIPSKSKVDPMRVQVNQVLLLPQNTKEVVEFPCTMLKLFKWYTLYNTLYQIVMINQCKQRSHGHPCGLIILPLPLSIPMIFVHILNNSESLHLASHWFNQAPFPCFMVSGILQHGGIWPTLDAVKWDYGGCWLCIGRRKTHNTFIIAREHYRTHCHWTGMLCLGSLWSQREPWTMVKTFPYVWGSTC